jgi:hypothetical protein
MKIECYGTFLSGGHLEFIPHFEVLFLKIHIFFYGLDYQKMSLDVFPYNCSPIIFQVRTLELLKMTFIEKKYFLTKNTTLSKCRINQNGDFFA